MKLRPPIAAAMALGLVLPAVASLALSVTSVPVANEQAAELPGLHNVFHLSAKLYTGSAPEGDAGFASLKELGIRTIITVDGTPPDVATAHRYGLRYVHLPFGYDGCPNPRANEIVKAVRDLPGPIYLHCHHGKHRAPVGAEYARIALDRVSNARAVKELERAGTGKEYTGLYGGVRAYRPPTAAELDAIHLEYREIAPTPPLVSAMVEIDQRMDRLKALQQAGWTTGDAAYEALQLRELFTEIQRRPDLRRRPTDFRAWMKESETSATTLETALRTGKGDAASTALGEVTATCGSCHAKYRDVPQPK